MKQQWTTLLCLTALLAHTCMSCGGQNVPSGESGTTDAISTSGIDPTASEETIQYHANVPNRDFGGEEFHVLGPDPNAYPSLLLDFDFDADSSDIVYSAIYQRNRMIEERYNIKFVSEYADSFDAPRQIIEKNVMAGEDAYQLAMLICRNAFPEVLKGYALLPEEIPYVDTTQPWYIQHVNDMMSVDGKKVLAYTDECMNAYLQTVCVFFNKNIMENNTMENPYTLVTEGKWTTDKFYEMANAVISDINGDGSYDRADLWGVSSESDMFFPSIWIGAEASTVQKDANGTPSYVAADNEKLVSILETLSSHLQTNGFFINSFNVFDGVGDVKRDQGTQFFAGGGALFRVSNIGAVLLLRDMNADFGILPLPKYDETQQTYYGRMIDGWIHVVPSTVENTELVGTVIEALGAESKNLVIPAFFDIALTDKLTRDHDSEVMLNLIFDNVTLDLGDTVWYDTIRAPLTDYIGNKQNNYASFFKKKEKMIVRTINKSLDELKDRSN